MLAVTHPEKANRHAAVRGLYRRVDLGPNIGHEFRPASIPLPVALAALRKG